MLDFTSALYLGLRHPSAALRPWDCLTLGRPAALGEPSAAAQVAGELARLQGCETAMLLPSTLHLFWDLFGVLSEQRIAILVDAGTYPIARWGVERAAARGIPVECFLHHDSGELARRARHWARQGRRPVIVADGFCPACGQAAPVAAYAAIAAGCGGYLVLDDTQALGILGAAPLAYAPYGTGGGGSLRWHGVRGPHIVVGASLAKGFGVPVAALSGSAGLLAQFHEHSETRVHCSPPSVAVLHAAQHALAVNRTQGDALRRRLAALAARLRLRFADVGLIVPQGPVFPAQSFLSARGLDLVRLYRGLLARGIRLLLTQVCGTPGIRLTALVTARHSNEEIDLAAQAIAAEAQVGGVLISPHREASWIRN
jgi:8-amino-7-oxononanoate synthase